MAGITLTAVSAAIYAARTLAYLPGLSVTDSVLTKNVDGDYAEVSFTYETGFEGIMTVWLEGGEHYGEW